MESVLSEIDEAAKPGTMLSVLAKPQFAAKLKKQVSIQLQYCHYCTTAVMTVAAHQCYYCLVLCCRQCFEQRNVFSSAFSL
jgi:hypothetical protein